MKLSFGQQLSSDFYHQAIADIIDVPHSAALIGEGSEVIGYDTKQSRDHHFGPRMTIFVDKKDITHTRDKIEQSAPMIFQDFSTTRYDDLLAKDVSYVEVSSLEDWLLITMNIDDIENISTAQWLTLPSQRLFNFSRSILFHDDHQLLENIKKELQWYPKDIWLWMMAYEWHRISILEPQLGRVIELGDILGANLLANKLIETIIRLTFLQKKQYQPYDKWLSHAFNEFTHGSKLQKNINEFLSAAFENKKDLLQKILLQVAQTHNELKITESITPSISEHTYGTEKRIITRPYKVINSFTFKEALLEQICDNHIAELVLVGNIDQMTGCDDLLINFTNWPDFLEVGYEHFLKDS